MDEVLKQILQIALIAAIAAVGAWIKKRRERDEAEVHGPAPQEVNLPRTKGAVPPPYEARTAPVADLLQRLQQRPVAVPPIYDAPVHPTYEAAPPRLPQEGEHVSAGDLTTAAELPPIGADSPVGITSGTTGQDLERLKKASERRRRWREAVIYSELLRPKFMEQ